MIRRAMGFLASRELLLVLGGAWVVFYVSYSVFSTEAFAAFIKGLGWNPLFQIPFALFILSLILYSAVRGAACFREGRLRFLLWVPLSLGVVAFLSGVLVSSAFRVKQWRTVGPGDVIGPEWREGGFSYVVDKLSPNIKERTFRTEGAEGAVFTHEPKITLARKDRGRPFGRQYEVGVFPPARIDGVYYHILDFGLAPAVRFSQDGRVINEGYLAVRILPPGAVENFRVEGLPYSFNLKILPEEVEDKKDHKISYYNLKRPTYGLEAVKGDEIVGRGASAEAVRFEDIEARFMGLSYWALVEAVQDPGVPAMAAGLALIALGLPMRGMLFFVRLFGKRPRPE